MGWGAMEVVDLDQLELGQETEELMRSLLISDGSSGAREREGWEEYKLIVTTLSLLKRFSLLHKHGSRRSCPEKIGNCRICTYKLCLECHSWRWGESLRNTGPWCVLEDFRASLLPKSQCGRLASLCSTLDSMYMKRILIPPANIFTIRRKGAHEVSSENWSKMPSFQNSESHRGGATRLVQRHVYLSRGSGNNI